MNETIFYKGYAMDYNKNTCEYIIIDDPSGEIIMTIHTRNWNSTRKKIDEICIKIFKDNVDKMEQEE